MNRTTDLDMAAEMDRVAAQMRERAERDVLGEATHRKGRAYVQAFIMAHRLVHRPTGTVLLFTRDEGHHTSGWLKNQDFERCYHLSISPMPPPPPLVILSRLAPPTVADLSDELHRRWVRAFFRENVRMLWAEPPYSPQGRAGHVWHHRLFCDPHWAPIMPRGEVYSTDLTEAGWMSSSEVIDGLDNDDQAEGER